VDAARLVFPLVIYISKMLVQAKKIAGFTAGHFDKQYTSQKLFLQVSRFF